MTVPALLAPDVEGLLRAKRSATGLLIGAAALFLATFALPDSTWVGFLRAAAEAGMVGGVADWFAVTALFRHPLGLPIPHTALIPRQKDQLATKLGEFVTGNFLTPDAVAEQVAEADLVRRAAERLAEPATAARVGAELATGIASLLGSLDERAVTDWVLELARRDLGRRSYAPVLGQFLARAVEGRTQRPLVDVGVTRLRSYLLEHREEVVPLVQGFANRKLLGWIVATDKRVNGWIDDAIDTLAEVEADSDHDVRRWLDGLLSSFADDLRYRPDVAADLDAQLRAFVEDPHVQSLLHVVLQDVVGSVRVSLDEVDGGLQQRITVLVQDIAARLLTEVSLRARIERALQQGVRYTVENYGDSVVLLIQRTVAQWDPRDASARIEAAVGRDLQFIRINGTVVGALVGLAIHTVAVVLG
ncbi:MAG: DUF445 domain-containing protein [Frankiales bacterium]|nr:DUF445 domain-containing protein [Frankiales bacterium]